MTQIDPSRPAALHVAATATSVERGLRVAGRAAIVAAIAWLVQPIAFAATLLNPANMDPDQTLAEFWSAGLPISYAVGIGALVFGVALAVLILSADGVRSTRREPGYAVAVAHWLGLVAAGAMLVAGAINLTGNGLAGLSLTMIPDASEGSRWLARQSYTVVHEALRLTTCLGFGAWLVVLARTGKREGVIGRGVAITIVVAAVLITLPGAATGLLTGMNLVLLALIPLAVAFLRRAGREARATTGA